MSEAKYEVGDRGETSVGYPTLRSLAYASYPMFTIEQTRSVRSFILPIWQVGF